MNYTAMAVAYLVLGIVLTLAVALDVVAEWIGLSLGLLVLVLSWPAAFIAWTAKKVDAASRFLFPRNKHRG